MIKFFRKIRQNLLSEGKTGKYLKYAVGEIVLVVIGILIALQINNWNTEKQKRLLGDSYLKEISKSIENDHIELLKTVSRNEILIKKTQELKNHLMENKPYNDSLANTFSEISLIFSYQFNVEVYESLKNNGLDLIKNEELRFSVINYYKEIYNLQKDSEDYNMAKTFRENIYPKYFKNFRWGRGAEPLDYEELKNSNEFLISLDYLINDYHYYIAVYEALISSMQNIQNQIDKEIIK